jgi:hypothetical protein
MVRTGIIITLTLAAVANFILWVISLNVVVYWEDCPGVPLVVFGHGLVMLVFEDVFEPPPPSVSYSFGPFSYTRHGEVTTMTEIEVPLLAPLVLIVVYPAVAFIRGPLRRYRRHKAGLCVHCGYDLRASSERCPECAQPFANKKKKTDAKCPRREKPTGPERAVHLSLCIDVAGAAMRPADPGVGSPLQKRAPAAPGWVTRLTQGRTGTRTFYNATNSTGHGEGKTPPLISCMP